MLTERKIFVETEKNGESAGFRITQSKQYNSDV